MPERLGIDMKSRGHMMQVLADGSGKGLGPELPYGVGVLCLDSQHQPCCHRRLGKGLIDGVMQELLFLLPDRIGGGAGVRFKAMFMFDGFNDLVPNVGRSILCLLSEL